MRPISSSTWTQYSTLQYSTAQYKYSTVQEVHHRKSGSEHSIALTVSLQNSLGQIRNGLYFTVQEEAADDQSGLLCMMDTVMTRPWRFTLESGKRSSELLGLAQLHVAASLLSPRSAVSARHLLQQPHVPRVPHHVPSSLPRYPAAPPAIHPGHAKRT